MSNEQVPGSAATAAKASLKGILDKPTLHWTLHGITYPLLLVYFAPILVIWWAAISSDLFASDSKHLTNVALAFVGPFFDTVRSTVAAVFIPFVMAYAVKNREEDNRIPMGTLFLFYVLLSFFGASAALYGTVELASDALGRVPHLNTDGKATPVIDVLKGVATMYAKEALTFVALILGIALRPAMTSATSKGDTKQ